MLYSMLFVSFLWIFFLNSFKFYERKTTRVRFRTRLAFCTLVTCHIPELPSTYPSYHQHTRVTVSIPELLPTYPSNFPHTRVTIHKPELPSTYPSYMLHTRVTSQIPELFPYPSCYRALVTYPSWPYPKRRFHHFQVLFFMSDSHSQYFCYRF